jgi:hypothetical protein
MKLLFIFFNLLLSNLMFSQDVKFTIEKKVKLDGYFVILIDYRDSINWQNNEILFSLICPKHSYPFPQIYNSVKSMGTLTYINEKFENFIKTDSLNYFSLFNLYLFKYYNYAYGKNNLDSSFKVDMKVAFSNAMVDSTPIFAAPFLSKNVEYGLYIKVVNISSLGYIIEYKNFKDFQSDFFTNNIDFTEKRLVSISHGSLGAKLYEVKNKAKNYQVFIPIKIEIK